jgi:hypothetical protein
MFDEALGRLQAVGNSAAVILPILLLGILIFGLGPILVRGVRAAALREVSTGSAAVLGSAGVGMVARFWSDPSRRREGWPATGRIVPRPRWQVMRAEAQPPAGERR